MKVYIVLAHPDRREILGHAANRARSMLDLDLMPFHALTDYSADLDATPDAENLARALVEVGAVPRQAADDAVHNAVAVTNGVDFLVTWNFRHIANAAMRSRIEWACRQAGYEPPVICTPNELMEANHGETSG